MASLNRVVLVGNLTRDPELRFTPAGKPVGRFRVAVNRTPYTNDQGERVEGVDYFNVSVFGRQAETSHQYLSKGSGVAIDGRLRSRSWETEDGQRRYAVEVNAQNVQFLPRGGEAAGGPSGPGEDFADVDVPPIEGGEDYPW
jgi:single-strand DNA-binding protein